MILVLQCEVLRKVSSTAGSDDEKLGSLKSLAPLFREILPMIDAEASAAPALSEVRYWLQELSEILAVGADGPFPDDLDRSLREVSSRADRLVDGMKFGFLYDRQRKLFSIGYRLAGAEGPGRLDGSYYDLMASEARLASFVAIAKGDVPQSHWFHLNRSLISLKGRRDARLLERVDVRVPDAPDVHAGLSRRRC